MHTARLEGRLRRQNGSVDEVLVLAEWSDAAVRLRTSCGDVIEAPAGAFSSAAIWLRGTMSGTWRRPSGAVIPRLAILADDTVTRVSDGVFARSLSIDTDALQSELLAAQISHPFALMRGPWFGKGDEPVEVDLGVAELIAQLWALGCVTTGACQNQRGLAYIAFEDADSAERFLKVVALHHRPDRPDAADHEGIYERISDVMDSEPDDWQAYRKSRRWRLKAQAREYGAFTEGDDRYAHETDFIVMITVIFPPEDIAAAEIALRSVNAAAGRVVDAGTFAVA